MGPDHSPQRKLRLLGLHGFRTSGAILKQQLSKWSPSLHDLIDVTAIDAPLPCIGKSEVEGIFDGPYYEWFRFNKEFTEFQGVEETISFISDYMKMHGPFDGLVGFSQGAVLSAALAGLQEKGMALQDVPRIRFVLLISPAQLRQDTYKTIYEEPAIECPSVFFLGEKDWLRPAGEVVLPSFQSPLIIRHPYGHTVPRLDTDNTATLTQFLMSKMLDSPEEETTYANAYAEEICVNA